MPSWYRRIDCRMEGDARYRRLSRPGPNGQTLWNHLLTGSHTESLPGLSIAGEAMLAEALGWTLKGFREAFGEVFGEGLAEADWNARVVWVPNAIKYNPPESANVVRSWGKIYDRVPECALKLKAHARLKAFIEGMGEGFAKAFAEAFGEGMPESPSPSPSPTPKNGGPAGGPPEPGCENSIPFEAIIEKLNTIAHRNFKHRPESNRQFIRARWRDGFRLPDFEAVIAYKAAEWKDSPEWSKFLRPETLFGTKFEGYLQGARSTPTPKAKEDRRWASWQERATVALEAGEFTDGLLFDAPNASKARQFVEDWQQSNRPITRAREEENG